MKGAFKKMKLCPTTGYNITTVIYIQVEYKSVTLVPKVNTKSSVKCSSVERGGHRHNTLLRSLFVAVC